MPICGRLVAEKPASAAQGASMTRSVKIPCKWKLNDITFFADFRFVLNFLVPLQYENWGRLHTEPMRNKVSQNPEWSDYEDQGLAEPRVKRLWRSRSRRNRRDRRNSSRSITSGSTKLKRRDRRNSSRSITSGSTKLNRRDRRKIFKEHHERVKEVKARTTER